MAANLIRRVVSSVLEDKYVTIDCKRAQIFHASGKEIIQACQEHSEKLNTFADQLVKQEHELFAMAVGRCCLTSSKQSRLWSAFHSLSTNELPKKWITSMWWLGEDLA